MDKKWIGEELKKTVRTQIKSRKPVIAKRTYKRLRKIVGDKEEIIRMMAACLMVEMYTMTQQNRTFDEQNYTRLLELLPDEEAIYEE